MLVERFGCRATVMIGGLLSGLGLAVSSLARTITDIYITSTITGEEVHTPTNPHLHSSTSMKTHQTLCPLLCRAGILPFFPALSGCHGPLL